MRNYRPNLEALEDRAVLTALNLFVGPHVAHFESAHLHRIHQQLVQPPVAVAVQAPSTVSVGTDFAVTAVALDSNSNPVAVTQIQTDLNGQIIPGSGYYAIWTSTDFGALAPNSPDYLLTGTTFHAFNAGTYELAVTIVSPDGLVLGSDPVTVTVV